MCASNDWTHEEPPLINAAEQTGINDNETISIRFNFTYVTCQVIPPPVFKEFPHGWVAVNNCLDSDPGDGPS